jgi:hypothetical protein
MDRALTKFSDHIFHEVLIEYFDKLELKNLVRNIGNDRMRYHKWLSVDFLYFEVLKSFVRLDFHQDLIEKIEKFDFKRILLIYSNKDNIDLRLFREQLESKMNPLLNLHYHLHHVEVSIQ